MALLTFAQISALGLRTSSFGIADLVAVVVLTAAVAVVTRLVTRIRAESAQMDALFEQAPPSVLMTGDYRVVRVNGEFARVFGYPREECQGRNLSELIVPAEAREQFQRHAEDVIQGRRVEAEVIRQRKDGARLHVLGVTVPVSGPGGEVAVFSTYRDITERKEAEIALQSLSLRLLEVQEAERKHLARELHDEIGQLLTGLGLLLRANTDLQDSALASRLEQARALVADLLSRVRGLSFDLRPADLDQLGLLPALLGLFERYSAQTGVLINFKHQGVEGRFAPGVETGAYRIVQEALTNAARHAGVAGVTVRVWTGAGALNLQVEDRGRGFDPEVTWKAPSTGGLLGMRERISLLGGSLSVESALGRGTTVTAELPLENLSQDAANA